MKTSRGSASQIKFTIIFNLDMSG